MDPTQLLETMADTCPKPGNNASAVWTLLVMDRKLSVLLQGLPLVTDTGILHYMGVYMDDFAESLQAWENIQQTENVSLLPRKEIDDGRMETNKTNRQTRYQRI